jgi:phosphate transport system substrate-binding protein
VAIGVNALNPVNDLSSAQLADVMTGRVEEWNAVGWPQGKKIVPVSCAKGTAYYEYMGKTILKDAPFSAGTVYVQVNPLVPAEIAKYPGAIGYIGQSVLKDKPGVRSITLDGVALSQETMDSGAYPLRMASFLITRGEPAGRLKEFLDFCLSPEGQEIVAKAGKFKVVN